MPSTIESLYEKYINSRGVATDTRKIEPGVLFIALAGKTLTVIGLRGKPWKKGPTVPSSMIDISW
jgi:UDP-N-acetylmuramyl pentapeptide synthase